MKKLFSLFLVFLVVGSSFGQNTEIEEDTLSVKDTLFLKDGLPFTGVETFILANGNKKSVTYDEGVETGKWQIINSKKKRVAIGIIKDGKKISNHYEYYPNDSVKVLVKKEDGETIRKLKYYPNGKQKEVISYQPNCINIDFIKNGIPDSLQKDSSGIIQDEFIYLLYPLKEAREVLTNPDNYVFDDTLTFDGNDVPHGKWYLYYDNGNVKEIRQYLYGIKTDTWIYNIENGNKWKSVEYNIKTHIKKEHEFFTKYGGYKTQKLWYEDLKYGMWKEWDFQGTLIEEDEKLEVLNNPSPEYIVDFAIGDEYLKSHKILDSLSVGRDRAFPVGFKFKDYLITLKTIDFTQTEEDGMIIYSVKMNAVYKSTAFILSLTNCINKDDNQLGECSNTSTFEIASYFTAPTAGEPNGAKISTNIFLTNLYVYSKFQKWLGYKIVMTESKTLDHGYKYHKK